MCKCNPQDPRPFCGDKEKLCFPIPKKKPREIEAELEVSVAAVAVVAAQKKDGSIELRAKSSGIQKVGGDALKKLKEMSDDERDEAYAEKQLIPELPGTRLDNVRWELFCQLYSLNTDYLGNGTQAYADAYSKDLSKPGAYASCQSASARLLSSGIILTRIDTLMGELVLNHTSVDKELAFTIVQRADLGSKVKAIAEYNRLKQRITEKSELLIRMPITQVAAEIEREQDAAASGTGKK